MNAIYESSGNTVAANPQQVWTKGKPTAVGWYVASFERELRMRRYWNGEAWSNPVWSDASPFQFDRAQTTRSTTQRGIEFMEN